MESGRDRARHDNAGRLTYIGKEMTRSMEFTRRETVSYGAYGWAVLIVVTAVVAVSTALILWAHAPVGQAYRLLFDGAFGSRFAITETLTRATPLIFTGLAVAVAFRARFYNIGIEGQLYLGALGAVAVGTGAIDASPWLLWPLMLFAAAAAGALLVVGPAIAKISFAVDEVVSTLLLNFVALLFVSMMLEGPMKDPSAMGWPQSYAVLDELRFPRLLEHTRVHAGLLLGMAIAVAIRVIVTRTLFGYEVNAVGANVAAARFAGIPTRAVLLKTALLSGGIAGLGGASEVIGRSGYLTLDMATGYGFVGIVIAMLSQLDAIAVIFVSIAAAALMVGGDSMSRVVGVPTYMTDVVVAVALLSVLPAALIIRYRVSFNR
jgi:general nucleoside transport system permease protein